MNQDQFKIYRYVARRLIDGRLTVGSQLESEAELSRRFDTTRMNAYRAIKQLERRGIVSRSKRAGTKVVKPLDVPLLRQLRAEVARRVGVIHSRNAYEHLHWTPAFRKALARTLSEEQFALEDFRFEHLDTRAALKAELQRLAGEGVAAFILSVRGDEDAFLVENLDLLYQYHNKICVYQTGALNWMHWPFNTVTINIFGEGELAAEYLVGRRGATRVAYCRHESSGETYLNFNRERFQGVTFAMRRLTDGQRRPEEWIGLDAIRENYVAAERRGEPAALIASTDDFACRIIDHFAERGLARPELLVGFDNNEEFRGYRLTTIVPPHAEMADALGKMLIRTLDLEAERHSVSYVKIDSQLVING